jgi:hypothetical protein
MHEGAENIPSEKMEVPLTTTCQIQMHGERQRKETYYTSWDRLWE